MRIAIEFDNPASGLWMFDHDKQVHTGSVNDLVQLLEPGDIDEFHLYCHPGNAAAYLIAREMSPDIKYQVFSPNLVASDPTIRLKSLFAQHASSTVFNRVCRQDGDHLTSWCLALPTLDDEQVVHTLKRHIAYPAISFPLGVDMVSTGRLLGGILRPSRFGVHEEMFPRLYRFLHINPATARGYTVNGDIPYIAFLAYKSWGANSGLDGAVMERPESFLHRIAREHSVVHATKAWIRYLVSYWTQVEIDPSVKREAGYFLKRTNEKNALQRHLNSVVA